MKRRKHRYRGYSKRTIILTIALFCSLFFGLGYSLLGTSLGLNGDVGVSKYDHTLYGVFLKAYQKNDKIQKYTDGHKDSYLINGNYDIYTWYQYGSINGDNSVYYNNVIFAGHCWQMFRTTDVGGVKMIYNGETVNNQCLDNRETHVGYKATSTMNMYSSYYYATDYSYDQDTGLFSLAGTITTGNINSGNYTCALSSSTGTCSELYQIYNHITGNEYYVFSIDASAFYSSIGQSPYNMNDNTLADTGYMFGKRYAHTESKIANENSVFGIRDLKTTYWYADDVFWNSSTSKWELVNPYQISNKADLLNLVGKYTFLNTSETYSNSSVYYLTGTIYRYSNYSGYYLDLSDSHSVSYYTHQYAYGDDYIDNGDGSFTIVDGLSFSTLDLINVRDSLQNKYVCVDAVNNICTEIIYVLKFDIGFLYIPQQYFYKYANGFTYDNGLYTLNNDSVNKSAPTTNAHYTCFNKTGVCENIYYMVNIFDNYDDNAHYYTFSNGEGINDLVNEAFNHNYNDSTIKMAIDSWYKKHLINYTSYIDDVIYCECRVHKNSSFTNESGGGIGGAFYFDSVDDYSCPRVYDQFSVSNNNAKLSFPIGLLTYNEATSITYSIKSPSETYLLDTTNFYNDYGRYFSLMTYMSSSGNFNLYHDTVDLKSKNIRNVRPVIALKPGTEYVSGTGSMADPYIVNTN